MLFHFLVAYEQESDSINVSESSKFGISEKHCEKKNNNFYPEFIQLNISIQLQIISQSIQQTNIQYNQIFSNRAK